LKTRFLSLFRAGLALLAACALCVPALAQPYPTRPVTIVVPFPAGGTLDRVARLLAQKLAVIWAQPVVVDNRSGAGGLVGTRSVLRSQADGYTLLVGSNGPNVIQPALRDVQFDPLKDVTPIANITSQPFILLVPENSPYQTVADVIQAARASDKLNYASSGIGSPSNYVGEVFRHAVAGRMTHIPYQGTAPSVAALLGGQVDLYFSPVSDAVGHMRAGKVRGLLVTTPQRTPLAPQVPSLADLKFEEPLMVLWIGLMGPANMPSATVAAINDAVQRALKEPDLRKALLEGADIRTGPANSSASPPQQRR
jgi:tripartite-type tricarboxylate transporter receptor subunit TctC